MEELFEIRVFKDEYTKTPILKTESNFTSFCDVVSRFFNFNDNQLKTYYQKICQRSSSCLKLKLDKNFVAHITMRDGVTDEMVRRYNIDNKLVDDMVVEKTPKVEKIKHGKRGRPKGSIKVSEEEKEKRRLAKKPVGRPKKPNKVIRIKGLRKPGRPRKVNV